LADADLFLQAKERIPSSGNAMHALHLRQQQKKETREEAPDGISFAFFFSSALF
jgi:hypothetical protein